ncbi:MAG: hypothetical protein PHU24_04430 [Sphaerochaetaceae bacterium]|nr:hypothetical protein [Sphaerochaetaceae bacterium]MDD2405682.1 hypothetical protein [Sphaerochaetaceae bacterium]MDD4260477.1 hypothetical protein [Sphaerochaetaceae bacterium]MDD4842595.1 hypothetical protein [Sphaerochaetaceae bacterium]
MPVIPKKIFGGACRDDYSELRPDGGKFWFWEGIGLDSQAKWDPHDGTFIYESIISILPRHTKR